MKCFKLENLFYSKKSHNLLNYLTLHIKDESIARKL